MIYKFVTNLLNDLFIHPKESSFIQFVRTFNEFVRTPRSVPPPAHHRQLCLHPPHHLMKTVGLQNAGLCLALICHIWTGRDLYCATLELLWHRTSIFIRLIFVDNWAKNTAQIAIICWANVGILLAVTLARCHFAHRADLIANGWLDVDPAPLTQHALHMPM